MCIHWYAHMLNMLYYIDRQHLSAIRGGRGGRGVSIPIPIFICDIIHATIPKVHVALWILILHYWVGSVQTGFYHVEDHSCFL